MTGHRVYRPMADIEGGFAATQGPCDHRLREELGSSGTATFYRCVSCRTAVIRQGGRWWVLRPARSYAANPM